MREAPEVTGRGSIGAWMLGLEVRRREKNGGVAWETLGQDNMTLNV